jgi:hypothetical protein
MPSFIGTNPDQVPSNGDLGLLAFRDFVGIYATPNTAPTIASAATIQPVAPITFVSGTTAISTITPPPEMVGGGQITLIPTGLWTTSVVTGGNIALASTAVLNRALILTYNTATGLWYPSY